MPGGHGPPGTLDGTGAVPEAPGPAVPMSGGLTVSSRCVVSVSTAARPCQERLLARLWPSPPSWGPWLLWVLPLLTQLNALLPAPRGPAASTSSPGLATSCPASQASPRHSGTSLLQRLRALGTCHPVTHASEAEPGLCGSLVLLSVDHKTRTGPSQVQVVVTQRQAPGSTGPEVAPAKSAGLCS